MSLDVYLVENKPVEVYSRNITHNLGKMAGCVDVSSGGGLTLYHVLWRPDENGFKLAYELIPYLARGYAELIGYPEKYKAYNPTNGWGSYDGLVEFVFSYLQSCRENPNAVIKVSR